MHIVAPANLEPCLVCQATSAHSSEHAARVEVALLPAVDAHLMVRVVVPGLARELVPPDAALPPLVHGVNGGTGTPCRPWTWASGSDQPRRMPCAQWASRAYLTSNAVLLCQVEP